MAFLFEWKDGVLHMAPWGWLVVVLLAGSIFGGSKN